MNEQYLIEQVELIGEGNEIGVSKLIEQFKLWSDAETRNYVKAKAHDPQPVLDFLSEKTLRGIGVNFHERFEMSLMEPIINGVYGDNSFREALGKGQIELLKIYVNLYCVMENKPTSVYLWAHEQAILEEILFYQSVAKSKGFRLSLSSILMTIPHIYLDFKKKFEEEETEIIEKMLTSALANLGKLAQPELFSQPTLEELNQALQFWRSVNS